MASPEVVTDPPPAEAEPRQASTKKGPVAFGKAGVVLTSLAELWRFADIVTASGLAPKGLDSVEKVVLAIQFGAEFGVAPMAAVRSVNVINGKPGWSGDMALALVRASGKLAFFEKRIEGADTKRKAIVTTRRSDNDETLVTEFSVAEAVLAKLWGRKGRNGEDTPWVTYPDRMLYYRALGFNLRDNFPDVMMAAPIAEELADIPIDVTPTSASSRRAGPQPVAGELPSAPPEDPLFTSLFTEKPGEEESFVLVEPKATEMAVAAWATPQDCKHELVPPSRVKPGKTVTCSDCGTDISSDVTGEAK